jgi:hypothetical protein
MFAGRSIASRAVPSGCRRRQSLPAAAVAHPCRLHTAMSCQVIYRLKGPCCIALLQSPLRKHVPLAATAAALELGSAASWARARRSPPLHSQDASSINTLLNSSQNMCSCPQTPQRFAWLHLTFTETWLEREREWGKSQCALPCRLGGVSNVPSALSDWQRPY